MKMRLAATSYFLTVVFIASPLAIAEDDLSDEFKKRQMAWSEYVSTQSRGFDVNYKNPFSPLDIALMSFADNCKDAGIRIHVVCKPGIFKPREYRIVRDEKVILSFLGHKETPIRTDGKMVFFCDYGDSTAGCTVVAYGLDDGKEIWRKALDQAKPMGHSGYYNKVIMKLLTGRTYPDSKKEGGASTIKIIGMESYCDYVQYLDAETGKSLAIRNYRVGFHDPRDTGK